MTEAVVAVGVAAQLTVWRLVARDQLPFWIATSTTFAVIGIVSVFAGNPRCCRETEVAAASVVGVASGLVLFVATRVVVDIATRHPRLHGAVADVYRRTQETRFVTALVLTLLVAVPSEELFWRGLVLPELSGATTSTTGALLSWAAAVGVNAAWASAPLLAGAVVGGALWTGLAAWSGGVVAPIASHLVWTGLMLVWPPQAARDKVPS
jgi:membrane protease YdiL (CAAX protease family)